MGRERTLRKDLPDGLYFDPRYETYYYRPSQGDRKRVPIGKVSRNDAILAWNRITGHRDVPAAAGTVGELVDNYLAEGVADLKPRTREDYVKRCKRIKARWGDRKYAISADQAARGGFFRASDVATHLRAARVAGRGAISANREMVVLASVFRFAIESGLCEYNPAKVRRNPENRPPRVITEAEIDREIERAKSQRMRLMIRFAKLSGWRQTDILGLQLQQVGDEYVNLVSSKTDVERDLLITPALREVLEEAKALPGRRKSMFVFPQKTGEGQTYWGFASAWRNQQAAIEFRAIRKWAINESRRQGENATDFAGHMDESTTRRHYLNDVKRVRPTK